MKDEQSETILGLLIGSFAFSLAIFMISTALTFHYEEYKDHFETMKKLYWEQKYWNWAAEDYAQQNRRLDEFKHKLPELPKIPEAAVLSLPESKNSNILRKLSKVDKKKDFCTPSFKGGDYDEYDDDLDSAKKFNLASFILSLIDVVLRVIEMFVFCSIFYKRKDPPKEKRGPKGGTYLTFLIVNFVICFIFMWMHIIAFNVFRNFYNCLDEIKEADLKKLRKEKDKKIRQWEDEIDNLSKKQDLTADEKEEIEIEKMLLQNYKDDNLKYVYNTYFNDFGDTYRLLLACIVLDACGAIMILATAIYFGFNYFKAEEEEDDDDQNKGKVTITYPYND